MILVVVTGSRGWTDRKVIEGRLEAIEATGELACVIEGGAQGADRIAGQWAARARKRGIGWVRFPAEWRRNGVYNPHAGKGRNTEMARWALKAQERCGWEVQVLAFMLTGPGASVSRGTQHMISTCKDLGLHGCVVRSGPRNPGG